MAKSNIRYKMMPLLFSAHSDKLNFMASLLRQFAQDDCHDRLDEFFVVHVIDGHHLPPRNHWRLDPTIQEHYRVHKHLKLTATL
jgi:hypothetical protein